jgi:hypothetical protein
VLALWPELGSETAGVAVPVPSKAFLVAVQLSSRRAVIREAFAELWPEGLPPGFMVKDRDAAIVEALKKRGLRGASSRTIHRALSPRENERN